MKSKRRFPLTSLISFCGLSWLLWLVANSFLRLDYDWDFWGVLGFFWTDGEPGILFQGLWCTIWISLVSIIFGSILGFFMGLALNSRDFVLRKSAVCFVEIFRNTPVLVQLYVLYFVVGTAFSWSPEVSGIVCLSLFCSAYLAEILRSAIIHLEKGQIEASKSLGLSSLMIMRFVAGPQILRRVLPSWIGQYVSLVKDSSLVSVISIMELTKAASSVVAASFRSFETWFVVALVYFILNFCISKLGRLLENYLSRDLKPIGK
jgi:polar amino acid transport system permease protein